MTKFEKVLLSLAVLLFVACLGEAGIILNQGLGFPTNGPCTPFKGEAGICSDDGVMSAYSADGVLTHLPAPGPQGIPGLDGKNGVDGTNGTNGLPGKDGAAGKDGINGVNGKDGAPGATGAQGLPGKDAVFPQSLIVTCPPTPAGSIPKGFTATCTFKLP